MSKIKSAWSKIPAFSRFVFISSVGIYLVSWIMPKILTLLNNEPDLTGSKFQLWRIITGPFVHSNLLYLLFSLLSYMPTAVIQERVEGTVKLSFRFFVLSALIGTLFVLLAFVVALKYPDILEDEAIGLWPILFAEIVIECNRNPDVARRLCCLPIEIKSKYYPWVLLGLFLVFFGL
mmetsp:Transcript_42985/g.31389  ORF Transcript_42985/g.31389 Transcript_42985/m.31389 type:complete len:177 (-) Transcript_42985:599-1129(-)